MMKTSGSEPFLKYAVCMTTSSCLLDVSGLVVTSTVTGVPKRRARVCRSSEKKRGRFFIGEYIGPDLTDGTDVSFERAGGADRGGGVQGGRWPAGGCVGSTTSCR